MTDLKATRPVADEDEVSLQRSTPDMSNFRELDIVPASLEARGEAFLGFLECPVVYRQMVAQGKTPHQLADLKREVILWKEAAYPDPREWHLSLLCLSELGLEVNSL